MYICLCKGVTDGQIRAAVSSGCDTLKSLRSGLGVGSQCGKCMVHAADLIRHSSTSVSSDNGTMVGHYSPQPA
ncbi:MAG: (2Fe-2S)-binding protein [Gammaproteobacteria bacterium HGW-Gammaproteobacteria-14]|nr:MAG: (2Fe-2S)-binding protein [Gammaproteobacteria bacterium HGW-Gammaproteobacteria-14]